MSRPFLLLGAFGCVLFPFFAVNILENVDVEDGSLSLCRHPAPSLPTRSHLSTSIFVLSMQGTPGAHKSNEGRLEAFKNKWIQACGSIPETHHCHGVLDPRRGYGVHISQLICLQKAKTINKDVLLFFEDDARLFNDSAPTFCNGESRSEILSRMPNDTLVAFLGGHEWEWKNDTKVGDKIELVLPPPKYGYRESTYSWGAYAFAVPRHNLDLLIKTLEDDLIYGFFEIDNKRRGDIIHEFLAVEESYYRIAQLTGLKAYATDPLMFWHQGGYSNTWHRDVDSIVNITTRKGLGLDNSLYNSLYWEDLKEKALEAAKLLGFEEDTWNEDEPIPIYSTPFADLTVKEKEAAKLLELEPLFSAENRHAPVQQRGEIYF